MTEVEIRVYLLDITSELEWSLKTLNELTFDFFTMSNFECIRVFRNKYENWESMKEAVKNIVWDNSRNIVEVQPTLKYEMDGKEHYEEFIKDKSGYLAFIDGELVELPVELKEKMINLSIDYAYRLLTEEKIEEQ